MGRITALMLRIRDSLSDSGVRWSDDRLLRLIDEAQKDIAFHSKLLRTKVDVPIIADTAEYELPSGAFAITRVISSGAASTTTTPSTDTGDMNRQVIPITSHAQMDMKDPSWENTVGDGIEYIVFDKQNPRWLKVYPIPDATDAISSYITDSSLGVLTDSTGDTVDAFGVTTDLTTSATLTTSFSSDFGVVTDMASLITSLIVYYQHIPATLDDYAQIDVEQVLEIDEIFDKALKHYVIGMALRDDKDTQNRKVGNEELQFYAIEVERATKSSSNDFVSTKKQHIGYNNGFTI